MKKLNVIIISIFSFFLLAAGTIDLNSLFNYGNQPIPAYINEDNTPADNGITNEAATLGRVLFYDTNLSLTNTVSCASCHKQEFAFGDNVIQSVGHDGGLTGRHSTRLSSARFGEEENFFWDERANSLEEQTTMPIQDHIEMGFSGDDGDPDIDSLISRLDDIYYYDELFNLAFGNQTITEEKMQDALAQFIRSMQSFDSKYDVGRSLVGNNNANFPNFTTEENNGKALYMGNNLAGCNRCHRAPEFDIDPNSNNNGVIGVAGSPVSLDLTNERSPSLRDIVNASGVENGPYMHDGSLATLADVINHYDDIPNIPINNNLDIRLQGGGGNLNLTDTEKDQLLAFLKTLGGSNLYTDERWSNPFDADGNLEILNGVLPIELTYFEVYQENNNVILEWETSSEINNDGYEIQHSQNAIEWEILDFVPGKNEAAQYQYTHYDPSIGDNYYRLKQFDLDGFTSLFEVKLVHIEDTHIVVNVYPNPTQDYVNIDASSNFELASIYSVNGELLRQIEISETARVDLTDLEIGTYYLRMTGNDVVSQSSKLVKF
jgi:cytochrome c peroxidase